MNLEVYRNFVAVVENGSIRRAAEHLFVAQPALSVQIKALEKDYGARLILSGRGAHRLQLSEEGWTLYRQARRLLALEEETRQAIENCANGTRGTLRISIAPSRMENFIARYAVPFTQLYPEVHYDIRESYHEQLLEDVRTGVSEIGIATNSVPDSELFEVLFSRREEFVLAGKSGQVNFKDDVALPLKELPDYPLAIAHSQGAYIPAYCKRHGLTLRVFAFVGNRSSALRFAEAGLACALVSREPSEKLSDSLCFRRLKAPELTISKTIFKRRGQQLSAPMQKFLEVYAAQLQNILHKSPK